MEIPVLDCSRVLTFGNTEDTEAADKIFGELLAKAIQQTGTLYLVNHGFETQTINDMFRCSKNFFDLSSEDKLKYKNPNYPTDLNGYIPSEARSVGRLVSQVPEERVEDLREIFGFKFPSTNFILPSEVPNWKLNIEKLNHQATRLTKILLKCLSMYLNLEDEDALIKIHPWTKNNQDSDFANHYILCNSYFDLKRNREFDDEATRLAAHCDTSTFTFLFQDSVGGLEAKGQEGSWIPVPAMDGAVILNSGFMLEVFSGGRLMAGEHRVRLLKETSGKVRQSFALFVTPDDLAKCVSLLPKISNWKPSYEYVEGENCLEFITGISKRFSKY